MGYAKLDTWSVIFSHGHYTAERNIRGEYESFSGSAHCLACAKSDVLQKRGSKVDTRGSTRTLCGSYLLATLQIATGTIETNEPSAIQPAKV
jgi:hypothetical protein